MKIRLLMAMTLLAGAGPALAAPPPATITVSVDKVSYGPSQKSVETFPAQAGTHVQDGSYVKTGAEPSRAELRFPTLSIARLGADTIFNYVAGANQVDLTAGTILFCKPKEASRDLIINTEAVVAGVSGTTGFVKVVHNRQGNLVYCLYGIIEGHSTAQVVGGKSYLLKSGQFLLIRPGVAPVLLHFNVPLLVDTSPLLTEFKPLPNEPEILAAKQNYLDDVRRGFIEPSPKGAVAGFTVELPGVPTTAFDSAQNAQHAGADTHNNGP